MAKKQKITKKPQKQKATIKKNKNNKIKGVDILLSDDEFIHILIKEKGLNKLKKEDLQRILEMRGVPKTKQPKKKDELIEYITKNIRK